MSFHWTLLHDTMFFLCCQCVSDASRECVCVCVWLNSQMFSHQSPWYLPGAKFAFLAVLAMTRVLICFVDLDLFYSSPSEEPDRQGRGPSALIKAADLVIFKRPTAQYLQIIIISFHFFWQNRAGPVGFHLVLCCSF